MKRRIILSIALVLSVAILSLMKSDSTVNAQPQRLFPYDTGIVRLGPNQILRVTLVNRSRDINDVYLVRFTQQSYMQTTCDGGVCRYEVSGQTTSDPVMLAPSEGASIGTSSGGIWRTTVLSNSRNVQVNAAIIDRTTGKVDSVYAIEFTGGRG